MRVARIVIVMGLALGLIVGLSPRPIAAPSAAGARQGPPLSQAALFSRAALQTRQGVDVQGLEMETAARAAVAERTAAARGAAALSALAVPGPGRQANTDWNARFQNETSIVLRGSGWIIGANDYGIGTPIGTGVYTDQGVNYFPPFPLLAATGVFAPPFLLLEPPAGTGDPALATGFTRAGAGLPAGLPVWYMASIGFSQTWCENGVFVYRSLDRGKNWTRPVVPLLAGGPLRTVVYQGDGVDCSVFHDKEWIAVDDTNGPRKGRVYVTWTKFLFTPDYVESPIMLAYSDNNGDSWSAPIEVNGSSLAICPNQVAGAAGECDENQFSVPVVLPNGKVAIAFENEQGTNGGDPNFRDQYLVTIFNPATDTVAGPYKVADLFDGFEDYPFNSDGRQTVCNSNFRLNSAGNIALDKNNGHLYVVWSDNRRHAGEFTPAPVFVGAFPYACPAGKKTDVDVFISRSTNGGVTWSAPVRVNQDTFGNDKDQWFPWVAVAPNGRVDVVFYDRRGDAGNKLAHTFLARSWNGGATWTDFAVSAFASNFDNAFPGGRFIGDYNGLAIRSDGKSFPVWTGVTPGKFDSDIFFEIVP